MGGKLKLQDTNNHVVSFTPKDGATGDRTVVIPDDIEKAHIHKGDFTGDIDTLFGANKVGIYGMVSGTTSSTIGLPFNSTGVQTTDNGTMEVTYQSNADITIQTIKSSNGSNFIFQRLKVGTGSWQDWAYFGSVIGSNSNGKYIKYADGTLIQYGGFTHASAAFTTASGALFRNVSTEVTIPFPISFIDTNIDLSIHPYQTAVFVSMNPYNLGTSQSNAIGYTMSSTTTGFTLKWSAIGRWRA